MFLQKISIIKLALFRKHSYKSVESLFFWFAGQEVLMVLGFEFKGSHLLGGCLPLEPYLQSLFLWLFWRWGFAICSGQPRPLSYFILRAVAETTGKHHHTQLFTLRMEAC
jgi:hypothetical protein